MKTGWPVVEIHSEGSMSQFFFISVHVIIS